MCFSRPRLNCGVTNHLNVILSSQRDLLFLQRVREKQKQMLRLRLGMTS